MKITNIDLPDFTLASLSWAGQFQDATLEKAFRKTTWPHTFHLLGRVCLISAIFYTLAGLGPIMEFGLDAKSSLLMCARLLILITATLLFVYSRPRYLGHTVTAQACLTLFLSGIGLYESVEAVILYKPGMEFSSPFTLLIILLFYLFPQLHFAPIALTASVSSVLYVLALLLFSAAPWQSCIQLALFFLFANILGAYIFIETMKSRRLQFQAITKITQLNEALNMEVKEKEKANGALIHLATTDHLTAIPNRRRFMEVLAAERERAIHPGASFCLLIIDIDHFKTVNDTKGHPVGDMVLKTLAQELHSSLRRSDFLGRLGGEEFGILLPHRDASEAFCVAERHRKRAQALSHKGHPDLSITVSIGIAQFTESREEVKTLYAQADEALYQAKERGRNRTVVYQADKKREGEGIEKSTSSLSAKEA